jgi:hypothetical protein
MRFLGKFWYLFAFSTFAAVVVVFVWNSPEPEPEVTAAYEAATFDPGPGSRNPAQLAKPPVPQPEAVARGEKSLAGHEPEYVKSMSDSEKQEFYAQLDEIDRIEKENAELEESEVIDESAFGVAQEQ